LIGFGGAFFSLAISKWMAKKSTGAQVIVEPRDRSEAWLLETVTRQAEAAGIARPEVAITTLPSPTPSPPARAATTPWWRSAPACCPG